jgi:hypothetical protein
MLEKREPKYKKKIIQKVIQKWSQNPSKITPKIDAKKETKKEERRPSPEQCAYPPNQSFQKTSFGVRCEESTRRKSNEG